VTELIRNTVRHGKGTKVEVSVHPIDDRLRVEIAVQDDGAGMDARELEACCRRGWSRNGSGEGLAMVVETVEGEHLGQFTIDSETGTGCRATVRLPVKFQPKKD